MKNDTKLLCVGMILLQSFIYGIMDPFARIVYQSMSVYYFLTLRYIIATLFFGLLFGRVITRELKTVSPRYYIIPCICMASAFVFSNIALQKTAATNMAFLRSLSALITPLLLFIFFQTKYKRHQLALMLIMLIGLYLLCAKGGLSSFGIGEIFALIAATLAAGSLAFGENSLQHVSAATLSFVQSASAIGICFICGLLFDSFSTIHRITVFEIGALLYAAIGCTFAGYMLQNTALKNISSKTVGMVQCTYPVMTAIMSYIVLHEKLTILGLIGAILIITCVFAESAMKVNR